MPQITSDAPSDFALYLASASPRRRELLDSVKVAYQTLVTDIDESRYDNELPRDYVSRLAVEKAQAAYNILHNKQAVNKPILAADTIVVKGNQVFGKPQNKQHAFAMWRELADSEHQVITAVALQVHAKLKLRCCETQVRFSSISEQQMARYWQTGEPRDKAGGYAIQGLASAWVTQIFGSYSSVVGLPLLDVNELLKEIELNWL